VTRLLITGVPRSGTSWIARTLQRTRGAGLVEEPDNENLEPFALAAKHGLGRFPLLCPGDVAPEYESLWDHAFAGKTRGTAVRSRASRLLLKGASRQEVAAAAAFSDYRLTPRLRAVKLLARSADRQLTRPRVIVKSVFAPLSLEWIAHRWEPQVLVVMRNPLNVLASWLELGYQGWHLDNHPAMDGLPETLAAPPPRNTFSRLARMTWELGLLMSALEVGSRRHPEWRVVVHEDICSDPSAHLKRICAELGLEWNERAESYLTEINRPGTGYSIERIASWEPQRWRERLTADQVEEIGSVLSEFPHIQHRYDLEEPWTTEPSVPEPPAEEGPRRLLTWTIPVALQLAEIMPVAEMTVS
jgi:hypothetical protein